MQKQALISVGGRIRNKCHFDKINLSHQGTALDQIGAHLSGQVSNLTTTQVRGRIIAVLMWATAQRIGFVHDYLPPRKQTS